MARIKVSIYNDDEHGRDIAVCVIRPRQPIETVIVEPRIENRTNNLCSLELNAGDVSVISVPGT